MRSASVSISLFFFSVVFCNAKGSSLSPSLGQLLTKENSVHSYNDNQNLLKYPMKLGAYSPQAWTQFHDFLSKGNSSLLVLGDMIRLSHGPQKRRYPEKLSHPLTRVKGSQKFGLFSEFKKINSDDHVEVYIDPLFKTPVVNKQLKRSETENRISTASNNFIKRTPSNVTASQIRPTSNVSKSNRRRCDAANFDCVDDVRHQSIDDLGRFLAVGPFVQTRLKDRKSN